MAEDGKRDWGNWIGAGAAIASPFIFWFVTEFVGPATEYMSQEVSFTFARWIGASVAVSLAIAAGVALRIMLQVAAQARPTPIAIPEPFEPDDVQSEVVRVMRWIDQPMTKEKLVNGMLEGGRKAGEEWGSLDLKHAIEGLYDNRWVRYSRDAPEFEQLELAAVALEYAKQKGFPIYKTK